MDLFGIPVSYLDESNYWKVALHHIEKFLPLRDLNISSDLCGVAFTIDELNIDFVSDSMAQNLIQQATNPMSLYKGPYLKIYLLAFDDSSFEKKNKQLVTAWLQTLAAQEEYIIIFFPSTFQIKESTHVIEPDDFKEVDKLKESLEKVKNVLSVYKSDAASRIYPIYILDEKYAREIEYNDVDLIVLQRAMRKSLEASIVQRIDMIMERASAMYESRNKAVIDYPTYFLTKENLALIYELCGMFMEAFQVYEELRNSYREFKMRYPDTITFRQEVFYKEKGNVNPLILNFAKKNFREMISSHEIGEFHFNQYIVARQCFFLLKLKLFYDLCERVKILVKEIFVFCPIPPANTPKAMTPDDQTASQIFVHVWVNQVLCGFYELLVREIFKTENQSALSALAINVTILKKLAVSHYTQLGKILFNLDLKSLFSGNLASEFDSFSKVSEIFLKSGETEAFPAGCSTQPLVSLPFEALDDQRFAFALENFGSYIKYLLDDLQELSSIYGRIGFKKDIMMVDIQKLQLLATFFGILAGNSDKIVSYLNLDLYRSWNEIEILAGLLIGKIYMHIKKPKQLLLHLHQLINKLHNHPEFLKTAWELFMTLASQVGESLELNDLSFITVPFIKSEEKWEQVEGEITADVLSSYPAQLTLNKVIFTLEAVRLPENGTEEQTATVIEKVLENVQLTHGRNSLAIRITTPEIGTYILKGLKVVVGTLTFVLPDRVINSPEKFEIKLKKQCDVLQVLPSEDIDWNSLLMSIDNMILMKITDIGVWLTGIKITNQKTAGMVTLLSAKIIVYSEDGNKPQHIGESPFSDKTAAINFPSTKVSFIYLMLTVGTKTLARNYTGSLDFVFTLENSGHVIDEMEVKNNFFVKKPFDFTVIPLLSGQYFLNLANRTPFNIYFETIDIGKRNIGKDVLLKVDEQFGNVQSFSGQEDPEINFELEVRILPENWRTLGINDVRVFENLSNQIIKISAKEQLPKLEPQIWFKFTYNFPTRCNFEEFIKFEVTIEATENTPPEHKRLSYSFENFEEEWMLFGSTMDSISINPNEPTKIELGGLPVVKGLVPIPRIIIYSEGDAGISAIEENHVDYIFPDHGAYVEVKTLEYVRSNKVQIKL